MIWTSHEVVLVNSAAHVGHRETVLAMLALLAFCITMSFSPVTSGCER